MPKIQNRFDTTSNWTAANPVLLVAERGYDTTLGQWKTGDGTTAWNSLSFESTGGGGGLDAAGVRAVALTGMASSGTALPTASDTVVSAWSKLLGYMTTLDATIRGTVLTGLGSTVASVTASDTMLVAIGKLQATKAVDTAVVHLTGNETVAGNKTFSGSTSFTGTVALSADAASALQPVTLQQLQAAAANIGKRARVRVASTANINLSAPGTTIDSVTMVSGDWFLAKDQTTAAQVGVYTFNGSAVTASRVGEYDTYDEHAGALIAVQEGTVNADKLFLCTSNVGGTLGSTAIVFASYSAPGVAASISVTDSGNYFAGTNAEAVLQEVGAGLLLKLDATIAEVDLSSGTAVNPTVAKSRKGFNANTTLTWAVSPTEGREWSLKLENTGGTDRVITIPSVFSDARQSTVTTVTIPANQSRILVFSHASGITSMFGEPISASDQRGFILAAGRTQDVAVDWVIDNPTAGTYTREVPFPFTAALLVGIANSGGTVTAQVQNNAVNTTGGTLNVTSTRATNAITAGNVFAKYDQVSVVLSSVVGVTRLVITIHGARTLT